MRTNTGCAAVGPGGNTWHPAGGATCTPTCRTRRLKAEISKIKLSSYLNLAACRIKLGGGEAAAKAAFEAAEQALKIEPHNTNQERKKGLLHGDAA